MIEEHDQVEEGLDGYTKASREFVAGESRGPGLNKLPDGDKEPRRNRIARWVPSKLF